MLNFILHLFPKNSRTLSTCKGDFIKIKGTYEAEGGTHVNIVWILTLKKTNIFLLSLRLNIIFSLKKSNYFLSASFFSFKMVFERNI